VKKYFNATYSEFKNFLLNDYLANKFRMYTISCNAPYGSGGLGRHLAEVVEDIRSKQLLERYYTPAPQPGDSAGRTVSLPMLCPILNYTPVRFSPGWKNHLGGEMFDRAVAAQLEPGQTIIGFNGKALHSFHRAQHLKYKQLELLSANSHVNNVMRQHQKGLQKYPFEQSWLNITQQKKTLKEYETADLIYVASEYTHQSFLQEGIPPKKLHRFVFKPSPRFQPATNRLNDGVFRVVYTGSNRSERDSNFARSLLAPDGANRTYSGGWLLYSWDELVSTRVVASGFPHSDCSGRSPPSLATSRRLCSSQF
jgi:hypothetical protein